MSRITAKDLGKVEEPCRSCELEAYGSGKNKIIYCKAKNARLIGSPGHGKCHQLPDCPKRVIKEK